MVLSSADMLRYVKTDTAKHVRTPGLFVAQVRDMRLVITGGVPGFILPHHN